MYQIMLKTYFLAVNRKKPHRYSKKTSKSAPNILDKFGEV